MQRIALKPVEKVCSLLWAPQFLLKFCLTISLAWNSLTAQSSTPLVKLCLWKPARKERLMTDDLTSEMEAFQNADPTEKGKYSRVLWCNRVPFVNSSKTGLIYCGKAVTNIMMLGGSWTVICFSCHCGAQRHRQCSCPCHDLMHFYHSFEPIWWYNLEEWEKLMQLVVCFNPPSCKGYSGLSRS